MLGEAASAEARLVPQGGGGGGGSGGDTGLHRRGVGSLVGHSWARGEGRLGKLPPTAGRCDGAGGHYYRISLNHADPLL